MTARHQVRLMLAVLALSVFPAVLLAETGGLSGRSVMFNVLTYDDPATPLFVGSGYAAKVIPGPEFGMVREGTEGLDVVPVLVDLSDHRIDLSYAETPPGQFASATFNGYVLTFPTNCVLIGGAQIDPTTTTLPLTYADLTLSANSLSINVAGLRFDQTTRIGVKVSVMDCPLS